MGVLRQLNESLRFKYQFHYKFYREKKVNINIADGHRKVTGERVNTKTLQANEVFILIA